MSDSSIRFPKRSDRLPWRVIDGRTILIHPGRSEVHELNEVGSLLWNLMDGSRDLDALAADVAREFEVEPAQALADSRDFAHQLESMGLLQWSEPSR